MQLDEALNSLGSVGRWQITYFLSLSVAVMFPAGWHMVSLVYIGRSLRGDSEFINFIFRISEYLNQ